MADINDKIDAAVVLMKAAEVSVPEGLDHIHIDADSLLGKAADNLAVAHRDVFDLKYNRVDTDPDIPRARRCIARTMVYCALALSLLSKEATE